MVTTPAQTPDAISPVGPPNTPKSGGMSRGMRETIESIAIALALAFLFKTFEAEAFVIPTGSMAPTLMGRHKDVVCPQCGYAYTASASDETDEEGYEHHIPNRQVVACTCPMCRYTMPTQAVDEKAEGNPNLRAWERDHETMIRELERELAEQLPGASHLEFWFGENGRQGQRRLRLGSPPGDPARSEQDLTLVDIRLGPADLEMLDALITAGTAASRAEAVGWALARIRERPAYARLSERARELDELKAHF